MKIFTKFSMKNAFVVLLAVIMIAVGGIYSSMNIKKESMPNINIPVITTITVYPGAAPEDVAEGVTNPIQKSISGIQGIKDVKTISNDNISIIVTEFNYSADLEKAKNNIIDAVNKITLPDGAQKPVTSRISFGSFPIMTYSIESSKNIDELSDFVNSKLTSDLSGIKGVSSVDVQGIQNKNLYIKLNEQKLRENGLTLQDVQTAVNSNNVSFPIGSTNIDEKSLTIRVSKKINSLDDIKNIPIVIMPKAAGQGMKVVLINDIATVEYSSETGSLFTKSNFKDGLLLNVYKTDDGNTIQVSKDVHDKIDDLTKANKDIKFNKIYDSSDSIKESVNGMVKEGVIGALFAMIVIALFLRDIKSTVISIISIPLSILIALILMPRFGITLNTMSLGGIAVAVGRIVDDSIVVIENIYRRFNLANVPDEEKDALIQEATHEVGSAITASTLTTIAVFAPLSFISGIIGKIFFPFAITVVICIISSLFVALTIVPVMSKYMLKNNKVKHEKKESVILLTYKKVLESALNHRVIVLLSSLAIFALSILMAGKIGVQFMPTDTNNIINAKLTMPAGTSATVTNNEALKFEDYLRKRTDIKSVTSSIGDTSNTGGLKIMTQGSNEGSFIIVLKDNAKKSKALDEITLKAKEFIKGTEYLLVTAQSVTGNQSDNLEVIVKGPDTQSISTAADLITNKIKDLNGLKNVKNNLSEKKSEISIAVDSNKAAANGINPLIAAGMVRSYLGFNKVTTINDGNYVNVMLGFQPKDLSSVEKVKDLEIQGMAGVIKISDIADVKIIEGPTSILTLDGKQYASVVGDIQGNDTAKTSSNAEKEIKKIKGSFPKDVTYEIGGSSKEINDSFSQMFIAMFVAIALVYIVMVITFGEGKTPFAILFSLPFAAVGAIGALFIVNKPLSVSGLIGMLMLIGIVVTNAIVLLDRVKTNQKLGMNIKDALLEAGSVRLRPIFMTAIATVMALLPLALGLSSGSLVSQSLGIVVIGGLTVSTLLTLILIPVIYSILNGYRKEVKNQ